MSCSAGTSDSATPPTAGDPARPDVVPDAPAPVPLELENLECGETMAVPAEGRLLTRLQYQNTVTDLFDGKVVGDWIKDFPAENEVLGYRTNAQFHRATPWLVEAQLVSAEAIAADVVRQLEALVPCAVQGAADSASARSCALEFIDTYGARAFRRPLRDSERAVLVDLYDRTVAAESFEGGVESVASALLQSPQFLYRWESDTSMPLGVPSPVDGTTAAQQVYALESFELASRLSYLVWNSMPDAELWEAARADLLRDPVQLRLQAERMLASPRATATLDDFTDQWLGLAKLNAAVRRVGTTVAEDGSTVPVVNTQYSNAWQRSLRAFVASAFLEEESFGDLFRSAKVFVDRALWGLYPTEAAFPGENDSLVALQYPPAERSGLLTQPGLMALLSHADQSAPVLRGTFVRDGLLCDPPPPPPPSVDPTPPALDPLATTRERFAQHTASASCSGCHKLIDPIGLGLENYDELGRYRATENGLPVDASGEIVNASEPSLDGPFSGARELSERLATSSHAQACFITQWYRYGMGRVEQNVDLCSVRQIYDGFSASGGNLKSILLGIVTSDAFRYRSVEAPAAASNLDGATSGAAPTVEGEQP